MHLLLVLLVLLISGPRNSKNYIFKSDFAAFLLASATDSSNGRGILIDETLVCCNPSVASFGDLNKCALARNFKCSSYLEKFSKISMSDNNNNNNNNNSIRANDIVLVTFASQDVMSYGAYSNAINSAYAESNGYPFVIVTEADHVEYRETFDHRWNKIHILKYALDIVAAESSSLNGMNSNSNFKLSNASGESKCPSGWASSAKYLVWLDTDLILLDLNLKIEKIIEQNPTSDIIISRDKATFVANSGFIIVRNSPSSIRFLHLWWNSFDRRRCCDQNALTWLYDRMSDEDKSRVALLPHDAINTNFPCWKNQKSYNPVLHLAGLSSLYRTAVFKFGWRNICKHLVPNTTYDNLQSSIPPAVPRPLPLPLPLPPQLGLSRRKLYSMVASLPHRRIHALAGINSDLKNMLSNSRHLLPDITVLNAIASKIGDVIKLDPDEPRVEPEVEGMLLSTVISVKLSLLRGYILRYNALKRYMSTHNLPFRDALWYSTDLSKRNMSISILDECFSIIATGFDLSSYLISHNKEFVHILKKFEGILFQDLPILVSKVSGERSVSSVVPKTYYFQFKFKHFLASTFKPSVLMESMVAKERDVISLNQQLGQCVELLEQSIEYWKRMASYNYFGTNYVIADPYKEGYEVLSELGVIQCFQKQNERGLVYLNNAAKLQEMTLQGYKDIRIMADEIMNECQSQLAITRANIDICKSDMKDKDNHDVLPYEKSRLKKQFRRKIKRNKEK